RGVTPGDDSRGVAGGRRPGAVLLCSRSARDGREEDRDHARTPDEAAASHAGHSPGARGRDRTSVFSTTPLWFADQTTSLTSGTEKSPPTPLPRPPPPPRLRARPASEAPCRAPGGTLSAASPTRSPPMPARPP